MARFRMLGVFEDAGQRDFLLGICDEIGMGSGIEITPEPLLTRGCRHGELVDAARAAPAYDGLLIGIDGGGHGGPEKIESLTHVLRRAGIGTEGANLLWCVAEPSIEEWIVADPAAFPAVLRQRGFAVQRAKRPTKPRNEGRAKSNLREWTERLIGHRLLRNGLEYARDVGRATRLERIARRRNPDLCRVFERLDRFLRPREARN